MPTFPSSLYYNLEICIYFKKSPSLVPTFSCLGNMCTHMKPYVYRNVHDGHAATEYPKWRLGGMVRYGTAVHCTELKSQLVVNRDNPEEPCVCVCISCVSFEEKREVGNYS